MRRSLEILQVTTGAVVSDPVELKRGCRCVAFFTTHALVYACERESILEMQFGDVVDDPVFGSMAAGAVVAHCLLVHIGMAGNTFGAGTGENQAGMAGAAVGCGMRAF